MAASILLWANCAQPQETTRNVTFVTPANTAKLKNANDAGVVIEIKPADEIPIGSKVVFSISSQKPGYLILIDVDSAGKVTQRYPNLYSMALPQGASDKANFVIPGKPFLVPDLGNPFAHFEYIAEAPAGEGLIIALLSPKPVHVADLPDIPQELVGKPEAANFLFDAARNLRIAPREAQAPLVDPQWSFAMKTYFIKP